MYKNYIFDLYGTLIDINTDEWSAKLWKSLQILYAYHGAEYTPQEIKREYGRLVDKEKASVRRRHPEFTVIDVKIEKVFRALFTQKGIKVPKSRIDFIAEAFRCYSTKYIKLYDGVQDLLDTLKAHGKKIYLLSNAQRVFTENELNMFGLDKYFDGVCISSDEECSKPDAHYYQTLFDRYGLKKEESIMIGNDYISDIGGAADFGIDSLYIHQSISPEIKGELRSQYTVMDGDVYKIKKLIVKE
nr:HAD family hydrolase [uncultured Ruminococcus sp.]